MFNDNESWLHKLRYAGKSCLRRERIFLLSLFSRQQTTLNTNKTLPSSNNNRYRNSTVFLQQKHLAIQKNLQQIQKSSITRNIIRSKMMILELNVYIISIQKDLQSRNLKIKNHHNENTLLTLTSSYLNDRLRKRRCFADKELDNAFIFPSFIDMTTINKSFLVTHLSNHHQKQQQHLFNKKKCTDFSVAAIIGQS